MRSLISSLLLCKCALDGMDINFDNSLRPIVGFGYEWWHYTINAYDLSNNPVSIIFLLGRAPNSDCYSLTNNTIYGYLGVISDKLNYQHEFNITQDFENMPNLYFDYENWNVQKKEKQLFLNIFENHLVINDYRGFYPQGDNGFVRVGSGKCDTAYGWSFPRVNLSGVLQDGTIIKGYGYGEHIVGTNINGSIYGIEHCHYIHSNTYQKMIDIQMCISETNNLTNTRGFLLDSNNNLINLNYMDFNSVASKFWNNYPINWIIELFQINIFLDSTISNQIRNIFDVKVWDGFVSDPKNNWFGITELIGY